MSVEVADVVIFGYGKLTNEIIKNFVSKKLKVICITNQSCYDNDYINSKNFDKYSYLEALKLKIITNSTIFAWRDSSMLLNQTETLYKWLGTTSYQSTKSFLLSSASVYMDKAEPLDESEQNVIIDDKQNKKLILEKTLFTLMKDKNIIRDYVHIEDVVQAVEKILEIEMNEVSFNISTGIGTSIARVLEIFANKGYRFENQNIIVNDDKIKLISILDCKKLSKFIDWNPGHISEVLNKLLSDKLN